MCSKCAQPVKAKSLCKKHYDRDFYQKNREYRLQKAKDYQKKYPTKANRYNRTYQTTPGGRLRSRRAAIRRMNAMGLATPKWLTREHLQQMEEFYVACPVGMEVDHILPIQGKAVCGLHVPWNLQYLTSLENVRKRNNHE